MDKYMYCLLNIFIGRYIRAGMERQFWKNN